MLSSMIQHKVNRWKKRSKRDLLLIFLCSLCLFFASYLKDHLGDIPANAMAFGMFSGTGTRHSYYSVKPEHFAPMLESLVWTFRQLLGDKYTDRTKVAWSKAFQSCASVMKKAMEEVILFSSSLWLFISKVF